MNLDDLRDALTRRYGPQYLLAVAEAIRQGDKYHCPICNHETTDREEAIYHQLSHMLEADKILLELGKKRGKD
jgi:Zn-finger domain-containing protein